MRGGSDGHCPALAEGGVEALCRAPTPSEYSSCAYAPRGDPFAVVSLVFSRFVSRYVARPGREDLHRVERARAIEAADGEESSSTPHCRGERAAGRGQRRLGRPCIPEGIVRLHGGQLLRTRKPN